MSDADTKPQWTDANTVTIRHSAEDLGPEILGEEPYDLIVTLGPLPEGATIRINGSSQ